MRNTWLVKNYGYVIRPTSPGVNDVFDTEPFVWVNSGNDTAFTFFRGEWTQKAPNRVIVTPTNNIYVIEDIDTVVYKYLTLGGLQIRLNGVIMRWQSI